MEGVTTLLLEGSEGTGCGAGLLEAGEDDLQE